MVLFEPGRIAYRWVIEGSLAWTYILINAQNPKIKVNKNDFVNLLVVYALITLYVMLTVIINGTDKIYAIRILLVPFTRMSTAFAFVLNFQKNDYTKEDIIKVIIACGVLEGVTAVLSFANPDIQKVFLSVYPADNLYTVIRFHGLASNLTFVTPVIQTIISLLSLYYALNNRWPYLFASMLCLFSAVINARTSLLIYLFASLLIAKTVAGKGLKYLGITVIKCSALIVCIYIFISLSSGFINSYRREWLSAGFNEMLYFFSDSKDNGSGSYYHYYSMWSQKLPQGIDLIFGRGLTIMLPNELGLQFDSGFVNDLWLGGVVYCLAVYSVYIRICIDMIKTKSENITMNKVLSIIIIATLAIGNIKGCIFEGSAIIFCVWMLYFISSNSFSKGRLREDTIEI